MNEWFPSSTAQNHDEKRGKASKLSHRVEGEGGKQKPPSDMYKARPFDLTRYAVPNERCQSRLHWMRLAQRFAPRFIVMGGYDCGRIKESERRGTIDLKRTENLMGRTDQWYIEINRASHVLMLSFGYHHAGSLALRRFRYMSGSSLMHIEPNLEQLLSGNSYRWLYNEDVREHAVSPSKSL